MSNHPSDEIADWASKQPEWRQDALRRVIIGPFTAKDEDEVISILMQEHGATDTGLIPVLLTKEHLPSRGQNASALRLVTIDQVSNVNRLLDGAALSFLPEGMTVIYGDNGSGKSGFVRIVKKACRARQKERILPNVFEKTRANATARFLVSEGDDPPESIIWTDDDKPSATALSRLAIFDSKCASVHVDGENRVTIVPHNIDCFEKLAQICDRLRERLKSEAAALKRELAGALPVVPTDSAASAFLANLQAKTKSDVEAICVWTPRDDERVAAIAALLKDPLAEATRLRRVLIATKAHLVALTRAENSLSEINLRTLTELRTAATVARTAASIAATGTFAHEPLTGVGENPWRLLFEAARSYSIEFAYPGEAFPVTRDSSHCVLCQQELSDTAKARFQRFADFVDGVANAAAKAAETKRDTALQAISLSSLAIPEPPKELEDYLKMQGFFAAISLYRTFLIERRTSALEGKEPPSAESPLAELQIEADKLEASVATASALSSADSTAMVALKSELAELNGRKGLSSYRDELIRRIQIFAKLDLLEKCMKSCATKGISDQGTKMLRAHVTETLTKALNDEKKALEISAIPLVLSGRTEKAVVQHKLKFDGATMIADTSHILSEGEHRAVALAAFLSELAMYPNSDPIVIDDPVSSLDHARRNKVAERLVTEARKRQVIVFTHDLSFLYETRFYADREGIPIKVFGIRRGPTGYGALDPDGDPWQAKTLNGRKQWLIEQVSKLRKLKSVLSDEYDAQVGFFYARLRETWERLIEEKMFANVVGRFQPSVQTLRLDEAVIDDDLVRAVYFGMSAASAYTGHDTAAARGSRVPTPDDAQKELDSLSDCLRQVDEKAKKAKISRKAMVAPSKTTAASAAAKT